VSNPSPTQPDQCDTREDHAANTREVCVSGAEQNGGKEQQNGTDQQDA
jgi:hypothetical protein